MQPARPPPIHSLPPHSMGPLHLRIPADFDLAAIALRLSLDARLCSLSQTSSWPLHSCPVAALLALDTTAHDPQGAGQGADRGLIVDRGLVADRGLGRAVGVGLPHRKFPGMVQQIAAEPGTLCIGSWRMGLGEALAEVGEMAYPSVNP